MTSQKGQDCGCSLWEDNFQSGVKRGQHRGVTLPLFTFPHHTWDCIAGLVLHSSLGSDGCSVWIPTSCMFNSQLFELEWSNLSSHTPVSDPAASAAHLHEYSHPLEGFICSALYCFIFPSLDKCLFPTAFHYFVRWSKSPLGLHHLLSPCPSLLPPQCSLFCFFAYCSFPTRSPTQCWNTPMPHIPAEGLCDGYSAPSLPGDLCLLP